MAGPGLRQRERSGPDLHGRRLGLRDHRLAGDQGQACRRPAVEVVVSKIKEISVETQDQSKRADQIQEAFSVFPEVTLQEDPPRGGDRRDRP